MSRELMSSSINQQWSNKMKGLFLDDERNPEDVTWIDYPENIEWTVVRSGDEFLYEFHRHNFQVFSFDHDIQGYNHRGVEVNKQYCRRKFIVLVMLLMMMCLVIRSVGPNTGIILRLLRVYNA